MIAGRHPTAWYEPGSDEYRTATTPRNATADQRPAFVARPPDAEAVAEVVRSARDRGLRVQPQATGHGAGGSIGADIVLIDTTSLDAVGVDADARVVVAGAGCTWEHVNGEAFEHGLLGPAGSAGTVGICGYTFGGGIGWLTRPHGLASSALRSVRFVDGAGRIRRAAEDADDIEDRVALWAFRGGGGVGIAVELELDLFPVHDLFAGYLLWPADHVDAVTDAWATAISEVADTVGTSISLLHLPPDPSFPEDLRGRPAVHLAVADNAGDGGADPLLDAVRAAAAPTVDTWGAADLGKLIGIHLDPPVAVPTIGAAEWLGDGAPGVTRDLLAHGAAPGSGIPMVEVRNVANAAPTREGALTSVPGAFLAHGVADLSDPGERPAVDAALADLMALAEPARLGRTAGSWLEGATAAPTALPEATRRRVAAAADAIDPDEVIARSRFLG